MKRILSLLLSLILITGMLTACGGAKDRESTQTATEPAVTEPTADEPSGDGALVTDALRAELKEDFEAIFTEFLYQGAAYMVYRGEEVYAGGAGMTKKTDGVPNSPDAVYHIASISKQFTAAAILQLCEQGKMSLDDTLGQYFPDYAIGGDITIHNLLSMQSGIPDFVRSYDEYGYEIASGSQASIDGVAEDNTLQENIDALKAYLFTQALLFAPGERYSYSNSNYLLLGLIVGQVSGTDCHDYIRMNFFEPLGMDTAGFMDDYDIDGAAVAKGYNRSGAYLLTYKGVAYGCGDIMASPKDIFKWTTALHGGRILGEDMYREMIAPHADAGGGVSYGYGLMKTVINGVTFYFHPGSIPGFISFAGYVPDQDYYIALMSNFGCENTATVAMKLTEIFGTKMTAALLSDK